MNTRIMTYGYKSDVINQPSGTRFDEHCERFVQEIQDARATCPKRPIIFICHSLGGILVIQIMLHSFYGQGSTPREIFDSVRGIFFFGTPFKGLDVDDLQSIVRGHAERKIDSYEASELLDMLKTDSQFLAKQRKDCVQMWEQLNGKVCSFYETEKTQIFNPSTLEREKQRVQKVQRGSARLDIVKETVVPLEGDHTNMVKLADKQDLAYRIIYKTMNEWLGMLARS